jgi:hypothetical protein
MAAWVDGARLDRLSDVPASRRASRGGTRDWRLYAVYSGEALVLLFGSGVLQ